MPFGIQPVVITHVIVHMPSKADKTCIEALALHGALHGHSTGKCLVHCGFYVCRVELFSLNP